METPESLTEGRLSVPGPGRTLLVTAEEWGDPIRDAVRNVAQSGNNALRGAWAEWLHEPSAPFDSSIQNERIAWLAINSWLLAVCAGPLEPNESSLGEAYDWFHGRSGTPSDDWGADPLQPIRGIAADRESLLEILPYALDPHGLATRRAVIRDSDKASVRAAKKKAGVVYTPADVAESMVRWVLEGTEGDEASCRLLDPACGTGVYLLAALKELTQRLPKGRLEICMDHLYGIDVNPVAVDSAGFVLLHHCIGELRNHTPASLWRALRLNLASADTLSLDPEIKSSTARLTAIAEDRSRAKTELLRDTTAGDHPVADHQAPRSLQDLFPEVHAFRQVVTNPPYAPLGRRADMSELAQRFQCLTSGGSANTDMYLPFMEFCQRVVAQQKGRSAVVVPLSLAFTRRRPARAVRQLMRETPGTWWLSFYDRTPDALFGDDVKQRSTIARFQSRADSSETRIFTGPLRRWTSRTRGQLFETDRFVSIDESQVVGLIPKLGSSHEAQVYAHLRARPDVLKTSWQSVSRTTASNSGATASDLLVAGTAYNWLSVCWGSMEEAVEAKPTSRSPMHLLRFANESDAAVAYSLLVSRLTYWLWRVEGDGFHVARWFLEGLPYSLSVLTDDDRAALQSLAYDTWSEAKESPITSVNSGSRSVSFDSSRSGMALDEIDQTIVRSLSIGPDFGEWLNSYCEVTRVVDMEDTVRRERLGVVA